MSKPPKTPPVEKPKCPPPAPGSSNLVWKYGMISAPPQRWSNSCKSGPLIIVNSPQSSTYVSELKNELKDGKYALPLNWPLEPKHSAEE